MNAVDESSHIARRRGIHLYHLCRQPAITAVHLNDLLRRCRGWISPPADMVLSCARRWQACRAWRRSTGRHRRRIGACTMRSRTSRATSSSSAVCAPQALRVTPPPVSFPPCDSPARPLNWLPYRVCGEISDLRLPWAQMQALCDLQIPRDLISLNVHVQP